MILERKERSGKKEENKKRTKRRQHNKPAIPNYENGCLKFLKTKHYYMTKRNYLKAPILLLALIASCCSLFAQEKTISGKITESNGNPIPGATVKVKNSSVATSTDSAGVFHIKVPSAESIITITHVGYGLRELKAGAGISPLNIAMVQQNNQLDDVVVIGYGTQKAKNVTSAIVSVDPKKLEDMPVATVTEALRGMVAGLNVSGGSTRPGVMPTLSIRQQFNWGKDGGNANPLIIIDDVIQIDPSTGLNSMDRLNMLDISEVESISVVKDGGAAIYGSRGSQGAIIIKTKRGKLGPPKITYSGKFEVNDAVSHEKVLTGKDFGIYSNRFGRAAGWGVNSFFSDVELNKMDTINSDWLRNDWGKGSAYQQSLTVSGGSDRATFFFGGSYYTQTPNLGSQDFNRWSFRAGSDVKVANNMKFSATLAATNSDIEKSFTKINFQDGYAVGGEQNDYSVLLHMPRYIPVVV
jgi:TonB-dependent SusC/RagA subfamily outer membrane receptor